MSNLDLSLAGYLAGSAPSTRLQRIRRAYDRAAVIYPASAMLFHAKAHRAALADSGIQDGMRVLEVATGSGEMFRRLVRTNPNGATLGLDLSPNMARRTAKRVRRKFPTSRALCQAADARRMPFPGETFDAAVCCYLLGLLSSEDIVSTIGEFHRVLRPGGRLALVMIAENLRLFNWNFKLLGRLMPAFCGGQVAEQVPELIRARGFQIVSDRHVRQTGYPSRVLVARK